MRNFKFILAFVALLSTKATFADAATEHLQLWYDEPAKVWSEALPIGNGRLGAMIFADPINARYQLNEETIWGGSPHNNTNPKAKAHLDEIRGLIFAGKYRDAYNISNKCIISQAAPGMPYQTVGSLHLDFNGIDTYSDYRRELDLNEAVATTSFVANGVTYTREAFASFADQLLIIRLSASEKGKISFNARYSTPFTENVEYSTTDRGELIIDGKTDTHETIEGKVRFRSIAKIENEGGRITATSDSTINVTGANSVTIYISIGTNFVNYKDVSGDEKAVAASYLKNINRNYKKCKAENIDLFSRYFDRLKLDLGKTAQSAKTTDVRLKEFQSEFDPELVVMYYQYGRYLLICSSQPGGQAAGLQGIWNDRRYAPWDGKYTTNINAEMNYWHSEIAALPEMHEPFLRLIRECSEKGRESAEMYGCRGWAVHHNTDIWRSTGAVDKALSGMWPTGNAWMCQDMWDHYLFNGDKEYVKEIYPIMRGACEFYLDFLVREPEHGWLVVAPSGSPENSPTINGRKTMGVYAGCTMDNQLLYDLMSNSIDAAEIVGEDPKFIDSLKMVRRDLAPMQIGEYGQLQEWIGDWDDPKDLHRHVSHMWGLYPGRQISPYSSPLLLDAAKQSLIYRGDPSTGWSMAWKIALWARMLDGNHAYKLIKDQFTYSSESHGRGGTYANLFCSHPPFQIDGNFGSTAGITEMFVQSHDGAVNLLPALPDVWGDGSIKGVRCRGGFTIKSLAWSDGELSEVEITSSLGGVIRVRSAVALTLDGVELKEATTKSCANPLLQFHQAKKPLVSPMARIHSSEQPSTYVYDIETRAGATITLNKKQ